MLHFTLHTLHAVVNLVVLKGVPDHHRQLCYACRYSMCIDIHVHVHVCIHKRVDIYMFVEPTQNIVHGLNHQLARGLMMYIHVHVQL